MASSGMLLHVALVRTDVAEELSASIMILVTLMMEALISETSVTRATRPNIPEDVTLQN
jgi:hypothetical protein